jgi:hypothetical protein
MGVEAGEGRTDRIYANHMGRYSPRFMSVAGGASELNEQVASVVCQLVKLQCKLIVA